MTDFKILIFGTSYIADDARRDVCRWWATIHNQLNRDCDVLLVDSDSPFSPGKFLAPYGFDHVRIFDGQPIAQAHRRVISFPDNIGHLNITGQDGWGRAMSRGFEHAILNGYDYVLYNDSDILFTRRAREFVERMAKKNINVSAPMDVIYWFMENGIMFAKVDYLKDIDFLAKYDWKSRPSKIDGSPRSVPEYIFEQIFGDEFWPLPARTFRNDQNNLSVETIKNGLYYGLDALTHCADPALYRAFLERNGIRI